MSCDCNVTKNKKKRNIKSRKIDKRKRKILMSKVFYNTIFQTYSIISCDTPCDCSHMPLHHPKIKSKKKENQIKKNR